MAANSPARRFVKRILAPVLGERSYAVLQAIAMGWDIRSGGWSEPELELVPLAVKPADTVIDIGANFGLWAYHLARAAGPHGRVYCFEPIPFTARTFRYISKALSFSHVDLVEKGVGETTTRMTFKVPVADLGNISAGLVHMGQRNDARAGKELWAQFDKTKEVECDVIAIDDYLPNLTNVSFLKCDIEGADLFAMRGAKKTLESHHPTVIIEINPWFLEGFGVKTEDLVEFFAKLGYRFYVYDAGRLTPAEVKDVTPRNWVFVHPSRRERLASILPAEA
jgi:FkbM family methyltransferase